jgi:MOSC domain-containing protein YiiM/ferredoxin-NADP reductase
MARLMSVNVGLPRDVAWQGRTVRTAIWKAPIHGRRMVRRLNVDGDGQGDLAGHGGEHRAVFVYQRESYAYWRDEIGLTGFDHGAFGENFTVEDLPDNTVCIGDRYRIGGAVFEVTQPRVTCYRIGIRLNNPQMAALLVAHDRPGFYMRVVEEGEVEAGDEIVRLLRGPEAMSVSEVSALLYKPGHPADRLAQALRIPALSAGWRSSFAALLDRTQAAGFTRGNPGLAPPAGPSPAWAGFRPLRVVDKIRESASVTSLTLEGSDGRPLAAGLPGQFVVLRLRPKPDAPALLRSYSLSGGPSAARYRVSIKCNPNGAAGAYVRDGVQIGDILDVTAPRGTFILKPGQGPVALVSAGIGATPLLAMLHALAVARSTRDVWWIHGTRNAAEHVFAGEVRSALKCLPRSHCSIRYSAPGPNDRLGIDFDGAGRMSASILEELGIPKDAAFYLCGPSEWTSDLMAGLTKWGLDRDQFHTELFTGAPALTPGIAGQRAKLPHPPSVPSELGPMVSFSRSGLTVRWGTAFQSILELAEACDVPVRWSCRTGVCHNCETALIEGNVSYRPDPVEPPAEGNILICCAQPDGDIALDL